MKQFIYLIALIFVVSSCDDDKYIIESALPNTAREFLNTHFYGVGFSHGEEERDNGTTTYDVTLKNGVDIEFTKSGDWISIDCESTLMPEGIIELIPKEISTYLKNNHPESKIIEIEKEIGGYEIGINNLPNDLIFAHDGTFVRYDN